MMMVMRVSVVRIGLVTRVKSLLAVQPDQGVGGPDSRPGVVNQLGSVGAAGRRLLLLLLLLRMLTRSLLHIFALLMPLLQILAMSIIVGNHGQRLENRRRGIIRQIRNHRCLGF